MSWTGGSMAGTGKTIAMGTVSLLGSDGAIGLDGGRDFENRGQAFWDNGHITFSSVAGTAGSGSIVTGDFASDGHLRVDSATLQTSGDHTVGGEVLLNPGSILSGADTLTFCGTLNWLAGTMTGAGTTKIGTGGTLTLAGNVVMQDGRPLLNDGTLIQTGGNVTIQNGATLTNNATMDLRGDGSWANAGGSAARWAFNNLGLLKKSGGGGTSVFSDVDFNNSGTVTIAQGQIVVNGVALIPG